VGKQAKNLRVLKAPGLASYNSMQHQICNEANVVIDKRQKFKL